MDNNIYETGISEEERLMALRKIVGLNPVDYLRIKIARWQDEKFREDYIRENPSDIIGVDYSDSLNFEYELRLRRLEDSMTRSWRSYLAIEHDGCGLRDYALGYVDQCVRNNRTESMNTGRGMK